MATQQSMLKTRSGSRSERVRSSRGAASEAETSTGQTGQPDQHYNLVSVLYHALQGAETYQQYIDDARTAGDEELAEFFAGCHEEEVDRAARAKSLLAERLDEGTDLEDDEDEFDEEDDA